MPVKYKRKTPFGVVFRFRGSVWPTVLPYCILNILWGYLVVYAQKNDISIGFSGEGHGLVGILVSFLVINKVYIALDRYMEARKHMGRALSHLRELNQLSITFTESQKDDDAKKWRKEMRSGILDLIDITVDTMRDEDKAAALARNEFAIPSEEDPMTFVLSLRLHLYNGCLLLGKDLQLLERLKMLDGLNNFVSDYQMLLKIASTPLPFPLMQMGRTLLLLWLFSMPLALVHLELSYLAVAEFLFFLTYGYLGLEVVGLQLLHPFGDGINDLNVTGMRDATVIGIKNDLTAFEGGKKRKSARKESPSTAKDSNGYRMMVDMIDRSFPPLAMDQV